MAGMLVKIVENNKDKILGELDESIDRALEAMGLLAEAYAKAGETAVDTGLLRNSITHALAGKSAAISSYHASNDKNGKQGVGFYAGTAPDKENTVFVGTNVEYAPYVELGHKLPSGGFVPGIHFLENAVKNHTAEYKKIALAALKGFK